MTPNEARYISPNLIELGGFGYGEATDAKSVRELKARMKENKKPCFATVVTYQEGGRKLLKRAGFELVAAKRTTAHGNTVLLYVWLPKTFRGGFKFSPNSLRGMSYCCSGSVYVSETYGRPREDGRIKLLLTKKFPKVVAKDRAVKILAKYKYFQVGVFKSQARTATKYRED